MTSHYVQAFIRIVFTFPPQRVLRGGFLGTSCQSRDRVPPFYEILINMDVGNPIVPVSMFPRLKRVPNGYGEGSWYSTSYKETRALLLFSNPKTSSPVASSSNTLGSRFQALQTFDNVRFRPSRPMDALLRHGGGRAKVERG